MKADHRSDLMWCMRLILAVLTIGGMVRPSSLLGGPASEDPPTASAVDFNQDEQIDFQDFVVLAQHWRGTDVMADVAPLPADGIIDCRDLSVLAQFWLHDAALPIYITWLGHASVKVAWTDQVIYIDPLNLSTSPHDATLVLVTHSHGDHYSPADIAKVWGPATQIIAPPGVAANYSPRQSIAPGQTIELSSVRVTGVAAYNTNKTNHPKANNWVGFVVQIGSRRIYLAGDTDLTDEMKALTDIDVAFLPAGGTYTMNAAEAAEATKYFQPELAIPYHWGRSVGTLADAQLFARNAACNATVMTRGETISSDDWRKDFSLAAHWTLDEQAGDVADDSAWGNHATVHGEPVWRPAEGVIDGALELDGVGNYVSTPFVLNPSAGAFSVFAWVKGGAAGQAVLSQEGGVNWLMAAAPSGALMTELKGFGRRDRMLASSFVVTDGEWHHVGLVWDGSNRALYVGDAEVARDTQSGLPGSTGGLFIGAGKGLEPGTFWSGLIDDVRIYNRAVKP